MIKLQKSVQITLIISIAVIILVIAGISFFKSNSTDDTIRVNGQAIEKATPDLITVYFNVDTKGNTSKEAEGANSFIVSKLKDYIIALGFSEEDIKTENFNIYPEYDYNYPIYDYADEKQKITGYRATHSLKVQFSTEEKDKIGSVIDAGASAGAGINYINFELSPSLEQQYKTAAIKTASEDAKVKAEAIASGFNKKIGRLVSVSLDSFNYYPTRLYDSSSSASGSDGMIQAESAKSAVAGITPSEQDISAYVTAVYKLR